MPASISKPRGDHRELFALRADRAEDLQQLGRPPYPQAHYASRLARALDYIDRHYGQPILLAELAAHAAFSPFHFHRIFCEWQGETPQAYIRRRRLERSAALLQYGGDGIAQVAQQCGFTSAPAFDRAFRAHFGRTPSRWRSGGHAAWRQHDAVAAVPLPDLAATQVRIATLLPVQTVYSRKLGRYQQGQEELWDRFAEQTGALGLAGQVCYGVGLDDPAVTPAQHCRYDLCMALPAGAQLSRTVPVRYISGGNHALLPYVGIVGETDGHWHWLQQVWLPQSGYMVSHDACFERYPDGIPQCGLVRSELCLPLARTPRKRAAQH